MRKLPYRATNEITQEFNDGIVTICRVENSAPVGLLPVESLAETFTVRYEEQRLGINRYYMARQNQIEIQRVIRVPKVDINTQDVAITEDGKKYRIDTVQAVKDVYPACYDLTLVAYKQNGE